MSKNDRPPTTVTAASLAGLVLALANAFLDPGLREPAARVLLMAGMVAATIWFGYVTAQLLGAAAALVRSRR